MEYQQFINFLKKHKCYDEFLKMSITYPRLQIMIDVALNNLPYSPLMPFIAISTLHGYKGILDYKYWMWLNGIWKKNYLKKI